MKESRGKTLQTVPPADDPDRAPDVLRENPIARSIEAIGALMEASPGDDTSFVRRLLDACACGSVAPEVACCALALILEQFVEQIDDDEQDSVTVLREGVVTPLADAVRRSSEPEPTWLVPAADIEVGLLGGEVPTAIDDIARMLLLLAGVGGVTQDDAVDRQIAALAESVLSKGLLTGDQSTETDGVGSVVVPAAADLASAAVLMWAIEYMDAAVPGLARSFVDHALGTRIPRGDLHQVAAIWHLDDGAVGAAPVDDVETTPATTTEENPS